MNDTNPNSDPIDSTHWRGRKVLVAGGCGFVGARLGRMLVDAGATVRIADSLVRGSLDAIADYRGRVEFMEGDLTHPDHAHAACDGMDTVFHLAANAAGVTYSGSHHATMLYQNGMLGLTVIEAARQTGVDRLVYFSSSCVYREGAPVPTPEDQGWVGPPEASNRGYGWAKRLGELHGELCAAESDLSLTSIRPVNITGAGEHYDLELGHVIPALIHKAFTAEDHLLVLGTGKQTRSFIDAGDVCRIAMLLAERGRDIDAINVSSPEEITIGQVAQMVIDGTGLDLPIVFDPTGPQGPARKAADITHLLEFLDGDYAFKPLAQSIKEMVEEFRRDHLGRD